MATPAEKKCLACKQVKPASEFHVRRRRGRVDLQARCKICMGINIAEWRSTHPGKFSDQKYRHRLMSKYGITVDDYDAMVIAQGGCCAICGRDNPGWDHSKRFIVDHDHKTGKVRALLCYPCNTAIGHFKDDVELMAKAIAYIERHR